ncbi:cilia- and flagella-associated protein 251-like [Pocillopora verrucosa]|uniref:cilia- and flagella-associated protein 251-like n=1 Tax=Pocillopora verrucosa TaxID=203993 RepID=UPI003342859C
MAEEAPALKKDSTMVVTAKEGEEFLEEHGKVHEDAKTRAQQKELEENEEDAASKLKRTSTMAATAQEGSDLLGDEERGKTRSETAAMKETDEEGDQEESGEDDDEEDEEEANGNCEENAGDKPAVKRDGTMVVTAAEGEKFLENEGHTVDGGTRGETEAVKAAIEESEADKQNGEKEEDKQDLKRKGTMQETVEEGEEFLKRQKTSNGDHQDEVTA